MAFPNRVYFLPYYNEWDNLFDSFRYPREKINPDDYMFTRRIDSSRPLAGWSDSRGIIIVNWYSIEILFEHPNTGIFRWK